MHKFYILIFRMLLKMTGNKGINMLGSKGQYNLAKPNSSDLPDSINGCPASQCGNFQTLVFGKIRNLWKQQSNTTNAGLNQLAGTSGFIHFHIEMFAVFF